MLIGADWVQASDGGSFDVANPASGAVIGQVPSATVADGLSAVDAAHAAATGWRTTAPRERAEVLRRAFDLMVERREDLARIVVLENGKAWRDALGEVDYAAEFFRWFSEEAVRGLGSVVTAPSGSNRIVVVHEPVGVALLVTPWNFPAAMATRKIAPALAAGCTVVLKPASDTPLTALAIGQLLLEAGLPPGVVNVVPSRRSGALGAALLADPRVRMVSFTGSTEVGRLLLAEAAKSVVRSAMELGGNAPFLVLADADLDNAVAGAMTAKMRNGGEACTAANRFYVHASIAQAFTERLAQAMSALKVGPGLDPDNDVGPLISTTARDEVDRLVQQSVDEGARVVTGGEGFGPGAFYQPTVLRDVPPDANILRHEIFGPVAPVVPFESVDDAIAMANDTEYGLVSYVYTADLATGMRVSEGLESGMVGLNRPVVSDPAAPFGGVKQSGLGREGGHEGMREYTESKYIAVSW